MSNAEQMILSDAIETAIRSERKVIIYRRISVCMMCACCGLIAYILASKE